MIYLKRHSTDKGTILAMCDKDLLGVTLNHNGVKVKISEHFYKGELAKAEETDLKNIEYWQINAFGEKSVSIVKKDIACSTSVMNIGGVPHIIVIRV